ncbi:MAG: cytochrome c [Anaerolineae bacterium]|nr:cytochrome c [Anaerolineae bacterium]
MFHKYRFLLLSSVIGLIALVLFAGLTDAQPTRALQATQAATQGAAGGDAARGAYLVRIAGCAGCHGQPKLAANNVVPLAGGNEFNLGPLGTFYAANLTGLQDWTTKEFDMALRQGIDPYTNRVLAPVMPYMVYHNMSDSDIAAIGAYLKSLTHVQNDIPATKLGQGHAALKPLPAASVPDVKKDDSAETGRYYVEAVANCARCHSPRNASGAVVAGKDYAGGTMNLGDQNNPRFAPPIVGAALVAEGYSKENFIGMLHTGIKPRGVPLRMPWPQYAHMTDSDLGAIWNFLQTKKVDSPWPVPTAPPPATQAPAAATRAATVAATQAR